MPRLGAHLSIAGGLPRAVDRAKASRCQALQIFTKSAGQWRARVLPAEEIALFRRRVEQTGIGPVVAHNSYLINLAAAAPALREQSIAALGDELDRAEALGLHGLVMHPGSYTSGSEALGLELIADALRGLLRARPDGRTRILLEHTAGQGTNLGHRFEHLAAILERVDGAPRVGVCLDTCHLLAAGYDICSEDGYEATFRDFDRLVGLDRINVFHLNDSKKPCGSRVDRHAHIGKGCIGLAPFRRLLNDPRFQDLPMLLETPKLDTPESRRASDADPWDRRNLRTLRKLLDPAPDARSRLAGGLIIIAMLISRPAAIIAFLILLVSPAPRARRGGFEGHKYIMAQVITRLPAAIRPFFVANRTFIVEHTVDPDLWRTAGWEQEPPRHFLDMDAYGPPPFTTLPHDQAEAVARFGREFVDRNGTLPWRTEEIYRKLVEAFTQKAPYARENIKFFSAVIGHYVADGHVPLHAALNYDGQLTGQRGIHSRFESELFDRHRARLKEVPGPSVAVPSVRELMFATLTRSFAFVQPILDADKAAVAGRTTYDDAYFAAFGRTAAPILDRRVADAISSIVSVISAAWAEAGQPPLPLQASRRPREIGR